MMLVVSNNDDSLDIWVCVLLAISTITDEHLPFSVSSATGSNLSFDSSLGKDCWVPSLESSEIVPGHLGKASEQYDNIMPLDTF